MKEINKNSNLKYLDIILIEKNKFFYKKLFQLLENNKELFNSVTINFNCYNTYSTAIFDKNNNKTLYFIEDKILLGLCNNNLFVQNTKLDIILIMGDDLTKEDLSVLKKVIDNNSLTLVGYIISENFTPNVTNFMILNFINEKLDKKN